MATQYPKQLVGVSDGTQVPAKYADGREYRAASRKSIFSKVPGTAWAVGDTIPLGRKPAGHKVVSIQLVTDTSLGSSTIDVGIAGAAGKYVAGATLTTTDRLTQIGCKATTMDDDPGDGEDLFATVGVANIASGTNLSFVIETIGYN